MANSELLRLTKVATSAFNAYKSALRQKGHKISGEIDLARLTGLSGWEEKLRRDWQEAVKACEVEAGLPSQAALPLDGVEIVNPLGLHVNHRYVYTETGTTFLFRGYNAGEDLYSFFHAEAGALQGSGSWVREMFDLVNAPSFDPTIPAEDPAIEGLEYTEDDGTQYVVKRVGPERFSELAAVESSAGLRKKSPVAKAIEILSDSTFVVTKSCDLEDPEKARLFLTPCVPVSKADKSEGTFKCGTEKYRLSGDPIIVMIAPVAEITETPDPGSIEQADPLKWVSDMVGRGFTFKDESEEPCFKLRGRSFSALWGQLRADEAEKDVVYISSLDLNVLRAEDGLEIPGYEEPEVIEQGPTDPNEPVPDIDSSSAHLEPEPESESQSGSEPAEEPASTMAAVEDPAPTASHYRIDPASVVTPNGYSMTFTETHDGRDLTVSILSEYVNGYTLFSLEWHDVDSVPNLYSPAAWLVSDASMLESGESFGAMALKLCAETIELRLSE